MKELLGLEKKKLENEIEKRKTKKRMIEIEVSSKENEVENLKQRL